MPYYYLCSIFCFFFCLSTKRTQRNCEKTSILINTKAIKQKRVIFLFFLSFWLFDNFNSVAELAILSDFEDGKEMNKESLLILFCFCYRFQQSFFSTQTPIYWPRRFIVYYFLLFTKRGKSVRGAKLSTTQIYNTQSSVKTED